jgi:citrate synthase
MNYIWLVVLTILKNMKVNGKEYPIYKMENKKCVKPPTRYWMIWLYMSYGIPAYSYYDMGILSRSDGWFLHITMGYHHIWQGIDVSSN